MPILGVLFLLACAGLVFILPPVLGRKASRSRKGFIAFLCVVGVLAALGVVVCLDVKEMSQRVAKHDLPSGHDGEDFMIGLWLAPYIAGSLFLGAFLGLVGWLVGLADRRTDGGKPPPPTSP